MNRLRTIVLHPFLFAVYPILALLAHNIQEVYPSAALRSLLVALAAAVILLAAGRLIFGSWAKAAVWVSVLLIIFFAYGHLYLLLKANSVLYPIIGRHRVLVTVALIILVGLAWLLVKRVKQTGLATQAFNLIAILLLILPVFQLGSYAVRSLSAESRANIQPATGNLLQPDPAKPLPDIYYIILDRYARDDILQNTFNYDNSSFLKELEARGFYVARCSMSNYAHTALALGSTLNMDYLDKLAISFQPGNTDRTLLTLFMRDSRVRQELEKIGYVTVSLSGFEPFQMPDAAFFFNPNIVQLTDKAGNPLVNPFESMLIKSTAGIILLDLKSVQNNRLAQDVNYPYAAHIQSQKYILNKLEYIPQIRGPKMIFVHIKIPHPPYVFGPTGELIENPPPFPETGYTIDPELIKKLYVDQVIYINSQILPLIDRIVAQSEVKPIILLQGDHGFDPPNRMEILSAYLVPDEVKSALYPAISPVNSFRLLFDNYFGGNYPLLPDVSYYSNYATPYEYTVIQDARPGCETPGK
ncbi:MAG: hypothetical protein WBV22_11085 [Anaerolineaceae bacterium]